MPDPDAPLIVVCPSCTTSNRVPPARLGGGGVCGRCRKPLFQARPLTLGAVNFDAHASKSDIPLLVDFWAAWCGPCRQMAPAFESAAGMLEPRVRLGKVDTEAEQAIAARFGIQSIPTLILLGKGRELGRRSGAMPAPAIATWVKQVLGG